MCTCVGIAPIYVSIKHIHAQREREKKREKKREKEREKETERELSVDGQNPALPIIRNIPKFP